MSTKTNAIRMLDNLQISYDLREYEVDPEDLSAETVARRGGVEETLMTESSRRP